MLKIYKILSSVLNLKLIQGLVKILLVNIRLN